MTVNVWPFLVSRNKSLGYQTVVAPDFMIDAKIAGLLANEAGGNLTDSPRYHELRKTKVGNITLAYRVVRATDGDELFRDEVGRPILWIEGVVLKGLGKNIVITERDLEEAHRRVINAYHEFWGQTGDVSIKRSQPFITSSETDAAGSVLDISTTGNDGRTTEDVNAFGNWVEGRHMMTKLTSGLAMAVISVLLLAVIIFNVIQAKKMVFLEERIDNLEQTVGISPLTTEGVGDQPTLTPPP